jgi:hypothetical protein
MTTLALRTSEDPFAIHLVLAMHGHLRVVTRSGDRPDKATLFGFPDKEGSGAPIGAGGRELHLLPGTAAIPCRTAHLSVLHYADCRDFRLNPARASASWNHRMQTVVGFPPTASPVPVQPAPGSPNTCRTGMMPKPPANRSDEPPSAEPAPAPSVGVTG